MKVNRFVFVVAFLALSFAVEAQSYSIRVTYNTNLRADASLDSAVVGTAPAGTTLQVVGQLNRWLEINRDGRDLWMASWVSHSRVENSGQTSSPTGTSAPIDNCCFVDRQCDADQEWTDGYWAYQNGQCATQTSTQATVPVASETSAIDNCCHSGWLCRTDQEWVNGFYAYRLNQCGLASPSGIVSSCCQLGWNCTEVIDHWLGEKVVREGFDCDLSVQVPYGRTVIDGSEVFITQVTAALEYLKGTVAHWYAYVVNVVTKIRGGPFGPGTFALEGAINIAPPHASEATVTLAGTILHESCHVNRWRAGLLRYETEEQIFIEENTCETVRTQAQEEADPDRPPNVILQQVIADFFSRGHHFDFNAAANVERERAHHLLAQGI